MVKNEVRALKYTLMHKNIAVADVEIDEAIGGINVIDNISAKEHLPIGVVHPLHHSESIDRYALNQWWAGRSIPASIFSFATCRKSSGTGLTNSANNAFSSSPHICIVLSK